MPDSTQAPVYDVYDASLARLADYGRQWLDAQYNGADARPLELSGIHLHLGTTNIALSVNVDEGQLIESHIQRTHGLLAVYADPLLRATVASILSPGTAQPYVYGDANFVYGDASFVYGAGARIIPNAGPPTFNTRLLPTQTAGAVTYNGNAGSTFDFDMPLPDSTDGPQQLFLYVSGAQVGRIDFPSTAVGNYFRLTTGGVAYLGLFQIVADPDHLALTPEQP